MILKWQCPQKRKGTGRWNQNLKNNNKKVKGDKWRISRNRNRRTSKKQSNKEMLRSTNNNKRGINWKPGKNRKEYKRLNKEKKKKE